jgi:hypothetical protein
VQLINLNSCSRVEAEMAGSGQWITAPPAIGSSKRWPLIRELRFGR